MPTTTKELKMVAMQLANEDEKAYYHGAYDGRWWHKGFAVVFSSEYTKTFCDLLNENGVKLPEPSQKDNMGLQVVWSWDIKHFTDSDNPEPGTMHEHRVRPRKYELDKKHNQYLVRSVNSHEQGEWFYCRGCSMKWVKPHNHHPNCPRSKEQHDIVYDSEGLRLEEEY